MTRVCILSLAAPLPICSGLCFLVMLLCPTLCGSRLPRDGSRVCVHTHKLVSSWGWSAERKEGRKDPRSSLRLACRRLSPSSLRPLAALHSLGLPQSLSRLFAEMGRTPL